MGRWGKKIQDWLGRPDEGGHESVAATEPGVVVADEEPAGAEVEESLQVEDDEPIEIEDAAADVGESTEECIDRLDRQDDWNPSTESADDLRVSPRIDHFGWARFSADGVEGEGLVINLSQIGALVERVTESLAAGTKFTLRLKPSGGFETLDLDAEVVREIDGGFAFRFLRVDTDALAVLCEVISQYTSEG